jgi:hypothetical protein
MKCAIMVEHSTLESYIVGPFNEVASAFAHAKENDLGRCDGLASNHRDPAEHQPETESEYKARGGKNHDWTFAVYKYQQV